MDPKASTPEPYILKLRAAVDLMLVGGNHLASYLIGRLGAGFADDLPPHTPHDEARARIRSQDDYEVWCCWSAIMRARNSLDVTA